ncbi:hypothetical protein RhiirA5_413067 [Rhizophagus irregularis]|uniref:F-box domain-containing protein n=1 Tax=Rhizophagus irregularis TaxID=588596 RepID=A0A2I1EHM7_9GLOM|nr:hypothetical protein RhiirA5_413067 [Rhizophagus irregularis]PKK74483.1 hypothetical protein RhiirC2_774754 [Rhizophagus irregularis]PKY21620.1 hypothetical protein RhiirB3_435270 [Rhizophagus irregularis]CAB5179186.1 unnamed protein product [Rhizophagus irregularis]
MVQLVADVLLLILNELRDDPSSLHSCVLVNKSWFSLAMPILWRSLYYTHEDSISFNKVFDVISYFLPSESPLFKNGFKLPSNRQLIFNYMTFFTHISPTFVNDIVQSVTTEKEAKIYDYKKNMLEEEIYKVIFNNCKNVKCFYWSTYHSLHLFPNAEPFFANLSSLGINLTIANPTILYELARICQNIVTLEINECNRDCLGLLHFINVQTKLQSLCLHLCDVREQLVYLSEAIEGKAVTLKRLTIKSSVTSISPKFLLSLRNLEYLVLNNYVNQLSRYTKVWSYYLSKADFPKLRYFEMSCLTNVLESFLILKYTNKFKSMTLLNDQYKLIFENDL